MLDNGLTDDECYTVFKGKITVENSTYCTIIMPCEWVEQPLERGSLTLRLPLDFHNSLHHSPLRLIFLSNFKILLVIVCHCVV